MRRVSRAHSGSSHSLPFRATCLSTLLLAFENLLETRHLIDASLSQTAPAITIHALPRKRRRSSCSPPTRNLSDNLSHSLRLVDYAEFKSLAQISFQTLELQPPSLRKSIVDKINYIALIEDMRLFTITTLYDTLWQKKHIYRDTLINSAARFTERGYPTEMNVIRNVKLIWSNAVEGALNDLVNSTHPDAMEQPLDPGKECIQLLDTLITSIEVFGTLTNACIETINTLMLQLLRQTFFILHANKTNGILVVSKINLTTGLIQKFSELSKLTESICASVVEIGIFFLDFVESKQNAVFNAYLGVGVRFIGACILLEQDERENLDLRFKVNTLNLN